MSCAIGCQSIGHRSSIQMQSSWNTCPHSSIFREPGLYILSKQITHSYIICFSTTFSRLRRIIMFAYFLLYYFSVSLSLFIVSTDLLKLWIVLVWSPVTSRRNFTFSVNNFFTIWSLSVWDNWLRCCSEDYHLSPLSTANINFRSANVTPISTSIFLYWM